MSSGSPALPPPDTFLIMGQSNSVGRGLTNNTYSNPTIRSYVYRKNSIWSALADPLDDLPTAECTYQSIANFGPLTGRGTVWVPLATALAADQDVSVAYVPSGVDAMVIAGLLPWPGDHWNVLSRYGACVTRAVEAARVGTLKAVLWWQGESDYETTKAEYKARLWELGDAIQADLGIPVIPCTIMDNDSPPYAAATISDAIREAWGSHNILEGPDLSDIVPSDGVHARTDENIAECASRWFVKVKAALYA